MKSMLLLGPLVLAASTLVAQDYHKFILEGGVGFTQPAGVSARRLDTGFNLQFAGGYNFHKNFGVVTEFGYNQMGVNSRFLQSLDIPDGRASIYSVTLDPIIRFAATRRFEAYVKGGAGFYRRTVEFSQPGVQTVTAFDPFYGMFFPVDVPTNIILGSNIQNKAGWNVGGGFAVSVRGDSTWKVFAESRYHYLYTSPVRTMMLPVTFGFRW